MTPPAKRLPVRRAVALAATYALGIFALAMWGFSRLLAGSGLWVWFAVGTILLAVSAILGTLVAFNFHFTGPDHPPRHAEPTPEEKREARRKDLIGKP